MVIVMIAIAMMIMLIAILITTSIATMMLYRMILPEERLVAQHQPQQTPIMILHPISLQSILPLLQIQRGLVSILILSNIVVQWDKKIDVFDWINHYHVRY